MEIGREVAISYTISRDVAVGRDWRRGQLVRRPVGYTRRKRGVRHRRSAGRV